VLEHIEDLEKLMQSKIRWDSKKLESFRNIGKEFLKNSLKE